MAMRGGAVTGSAAVGRKSAPDVVAAATTGSGVGAGGTVAGTDEAGLALAELPSAAAFVCSIRATRVPSDTLSPTATLSAVITPDTGEGTSMVALSDSTVISESSALTVSPTLTSSSMIGTSLKSPMSGTFTSTIWAMLPPQGRPKGAASQLIGAGKAREP